MALAVDLPTRRGEDSDDPRARADLGRGGVPVDSAEDLGQLLDAGALDADAIGLDAGPAAPFVAAMLVAAVEERGSTPNALVGSVTHGGELLGAEADARLADDLVRYCAEQMPRLSVLAAPESPRELAPDPAPASTVEHLTALRADRLDAIVLNALERLAEAAGTSANLMPSLIDCARCRTTLGEMVGALRTAAAQPEA